MYLFLILVALITVIFHLYRLSKKNFDYWKKKGVKYVKPVPFFGSYLPVVTKSIGLHDLVQKIYNDFPEERYVGFFQFTEPALMLRDVELIKNITIKNFENFVDHLGFIDPEADPLWGKNLFSSTGERWRDLRQTLSPVFTSSKMRTMFVLMNECAKQLTEYLKEQNKDIIEVDVKDITTRVTNDVIASAAFGIRCNSIKHKDNEFLLAGRELTDFSGIKRFKFLLYTHYPTIAKLFKLKFISPRVGKFFETVIEETIKIREEKNVVRPDLIHSLMLARKGKLKYEELMNLPDTGFAAVQESEIGRNVKNAQFLTNEDITAQALVFFFGGFDTVSVLMCFTCHELAVNPAIQKRLREEIKKTFKENNNITYETLTGMKYLDMVLSESLRKWPPAFWIDRKCTKSFKIDPERNGEKEVVLNEGDVCWLPILAIHRDPHFYPDPEKFEPERFNDENKENIPTGAYLPFGIGPRNCIGSRFALLETKLFLFHLLLHFELVVSKKTCIPLKICKNNALFTAEGGFHLALKLTE